MGTVGVLNGERVKIKSCKGVSGNKGWMEREGASVLHLF